MHRYGTASNMESWWSMNVFSHVASSADYEDMQIICVLWHLGRFFS